MTRHTHTHTHRLLMLHMVCLSANATVSQLALCLRYNFDQTIRQLTSLSKFLKGTCHHQQDF